MTCVLLLCTLFTGISNPIPPRAAAPADDQPMHLTYDDLLRSMIDLRWLATRPRDGDKGYQFSSYDRRSEAGPDDPDAWFANNDRGQYLGETTYQERTVYVMADCEGPGVVTRIWSANPEGDLLFFIDGELTLTIPFQDLCSGKKEPFIAPISGEHSRGWNCYLPIPFQKHLQIVATKNTFYYHVNVLYMPSYRVPSFSLDLLDSSEKTVHEVARVLEERSLYPPASEATKRFDREIPIGVTSSPRIQQIISLAGPAFLRRFTLRPKVDDPDRFLREARLVMIADGEQTVDCPLGDFFGVAPGWVPYRALPVGVTDDGSGYCQFPIPYARELTIGLINDGGQAARVSGTFEIELGSVAHYPLRFHAGWRTARDLKTRPRSDYPILETRGNGRFVGCSLMVANPVRNWWGEGDEHFWVDDETFPSTFGTGTEDYFGYAWCCPEPFQHAYHNQPRCDGPGNWGYTSVNRFQILDAVPYSRSFRFDLEVWHWADCSIDLASTAYWYARPSGSDTFTAVALEDRVARELEPLKIKRVKGALEGEKLQIVASSGGTTSIQNMAGFGADWSGEAQLWWTRAKPGDRLDLRVPVARAATYRLHAQFTRAADYGIVQILVDDKTLGPPLDLYHDGVVATGELDLGQVTLQPPAATLSLLITGCHPDAVKRYMVGLDYLRLVPRGEE